METYIFDVVLCIVAIVVVVFTAKKGFVLSLLGTVSVVLSGFLSYKFTKPVSQFIYSSFLYDKIQEKLTVAVLSLSQDASCDTKLDAMVNILPEGAVSLSEGYGFNLNEALNSIGAELFTNDEIVKLFIDNIASEIIMTVLEIVVFAVLFVLLSFVLKYVSMIFNRIVKKIPLVGKLNTTLGGILGIIKAALILLIICFVVCPVVLATDIPWIEKIISESFIFQFLMEDNPFGKFI